MFPRLCQNLFLPTTHRHTNSLTHGRNTLRPYKLTKNFDFSEKLFFVKASKSLQYLQFTVYFPRYHPSPE